jgi:HK97 family phage major capsid protein
MDVAGQSYFSYSGYPIYMSEHMPRTASGAATVCLFGNFYETTLTGIRQDVSVAMSDAPYFANDQMAIRIKASWHCLNHRTGVNGDGYVGLLTAIP